MAAYTLEQRKVFDEALRVVPGVLACKQRADHEGARELVRGVMIAGMEEGFSACMVWSIMFSASMHWFMQATYRIAKISGKEFEEITSEMAMLAALWETDDV